MVARKAFSSTQKKAPQFLILENVDRLLKSPANEIFCTNA